MCASSSRTRRPSTTTIRASWQLWWSAAPSCSPSVAQVCRGAWADARVGREQGTGCRHRALQEDVERLTTFPNIPDRYCTLRLVDPSCADDPELEHGVDFRCFIPPQNREPTLRASGDIIILHRVKASEF